MKCWSTSGSYVVVTNTFPTIGHLKSRNMVQHLPNWKIDQGWMRLKLLPIDSLHSFCRSKILQLLGIDNDLLASSSTSRRVDSANHCSEQPRSATPKASPAPTRLAPTPATNPIRSAMSFNSSNGGTPRSRVTLFQVMCNNINQALAMDSEAPRIRSSPPPLENQVFVSKWIDYSHKYGLGYLLTNGCVGVSFNDSTSIILSADKVYVLPRETNAL